MSQIAQSRDLADPATIRAFADVVQSLERLKLLLVLTVADIRGVGPGVWNGWKGQLLRTLYWETELVVAGGHTRIDRRQRIAAAQGELRRALAGWPEPDIEAVLARHGPAYWLKVDPGRRVAHATLLRRAAAEGRTLATEVRTDAFRSVTELTVLAPDQSRLLATIAGACAAAGANIVDAQIFTTADGAALDTIFVSRAFEREDDELRRAAKLAAAVEDAVLGRVALPQAVAERAARRGRSQAFSVEPEVVIDNTGSGDTTLIEVTGLDRPGLLYELTTALSDVALDIRSAHVATFGERAVDVFYVSDAAGGKILDAKRQATVRDRLLAVFRPARRAA
jgi:[protein-PII] uridylyltransferase